MSQINVNIDSKFTGEPEYHSWVLRNLTYNTCLVSNIIIDPNKLYRMIHRLEDAYKDTRPTKLSIDSAHEFGVVYINVLKNFETDISVFIDTNNPQYCNAHIISDYSGIREFHDIIKDFITDEPRGDEYEMHISYFMKKKGNIVWNSTSKWTSEFNYVTDELYPRINVNAMVEQYLNGTENILILTGAPGTGKTSFIKKVMKSAAEHIEQDISVAYIKDEELIKDNDLWGELTNRSFDMLVFDDLDSGLEPRSADKNCSFVNQLLSYSDGLFDHKAKIIITTNRPLTEIDTAIIRPGRCFDILNMPVLSRDEAIVVWDDLYVLDAESFNQCFSDRTEISQAFLCSEAKRMQSNLPKNYLLDQSISIRNKFMK